MYFFFSYGEVDDMLQKYNESDEKNKTNIFSISVVVKKYYENLKRLRLIHLKKCQKVLKYYVNKMHVKYNGFQNKKIFKGTFFMNRPCIAVLDKVHSTIHSKNIYAE